MGWVVKYATARGWLVYHTYDSRRSVAGFPDLVLVRRERILFAELKRSQKEQLKPEQERWKAALHAARQACFVWTPELWTEIQGILA